MFFKQCSEAFTICFRRQGEAKTNKFLKRLIVRTLDFITLLQTLGQLLATLGYCI